MIRAVLAWFLLLATLPAAGAEPELAFVVAVFRHGVRAPLSDFAAKANEHAGQSWPATPSDWGAKEWGGLTRHGTLLAERLGEYYAGYYATAWPEGFKAFLWADVDPRNKDTANALATGMRRQPRVDVAVDSRAGGTDPLFHPFKAGCGMPARSQLARIATQLDRDRDEWTRRYAGELQRLDAALGCTTTSATCKPVSRSTDVARAWKSGEPREAPVEWKGRFSYASSATEAFLLEHANGMEVAWGRDPDIGRLLHLHELYFDATQRDPYLAKIGGSALLREVADQIDRKTAGAPGKCPRGDGRARFVGLVGHDTNLASLNALLKIEWRFDKLQDIDMRGLPANDALPAGALVFEVYERADGPLVRIQYVAQTLGQMRTVGRGAFRVATTCSGITPCEIPLATFRDMVAGAIGADNPFLPVCSADGAQPVCR